MSRQEKKWNKPGHSSWGKMQSSRAHPPGLKGKQIGLYFRDQKRRSKLSKEHSNVKPRKQFMINFQLPPAVENKLRMNLQTIAIIAERLNIPLVKCEGLPLTQNQFASDVEFINFEKDDINQDKSLDNVFKKPKPVVYKQEKIEGQELPGTSSAANFIPIDDAAQSEYVLDKRLLSLRGGGDYKYGYEDIITGTFDEKLDESLAKGISINMCTEDILELNARFCGEYQDMLIRKKYKEMKEFRDRLPTYKKSQELLDVINNNQVVVISGETGCGKSTQVPQIILDDAICKGKGANVKILVTQPRRIAASSLAARVAEERAEPMGSSVGYAVRLEKVDARSRGSIMFVTTGILLAELEVNQGLVNNSHVILDEVHERDCDMDLSMCLLKIVLKKRKDFKVILMSATIDAEKISEYFDNCPMIHIEGLAYPVEDIYLEDILEATKFQLTDVKSKVFNRPQPKWMKHAGRNAKSRDAKEIEKQVQYRAEISPWLESIKKNISREVYNTLADPRIEELDKGLVVALLKHIVYQKPPGAILVFLPGIGDITKVMKLMDDTNEFPKSLCEIYPLHSKLASLDQRKIFERPPPHMRKIIIATNIAETSITIDDIVYVIDCGKVKMKGLNVEDNMTTLKTEWVSQANLRQRRGRAGRCQPGVCYHLITTYRASTLAERILPELQRSDLLEPVLCTKRLRLGKAGIALNMVPSPPAQSTIEWAVRHLQQCGALDDDEKLTPLGWHLARLPVHPAAGKLLLLGTLFGCLDRAASVAAVWGFKDPFQLVIGKEREVDAVRIRLSQGEPSDHVAISEAIIQWEKASPHRRYSFAFEHFLSHSTVELLSEMKSQLGDSLRQMGWLASGDVKSGWENRNADNLSLFKAIVAASLYPNVVSVKWHNRRKRPGAVRVVTAEKSHVFVHPSSVIAGSARINQPMRVTGGNWMVYWLKQKTSEVYLFEVSIIYTLPLLFFGELKVCQSEDFVPVLKTLDDEVNFSISTAKVRCQRQTAQLLFELRSLLDQVLASKVMSKSDHATPRSDFEQCVLNSVADLITAEDEGAEYLDDVSDSDQSVSSVQY
ncbi:ATP-dependent RNA helicase DHX36-like isoform X2 [Hyposmocoma kahamanoa]|uniref:ATP-dependent RNA helicase DHX36-like isoform X2 n=1 Tax=Hyposmocoma kahamanoa TaxID=1477025 RepID=UPI000E6D85B2|nr:ATP-dependent RNA helicase DHX36-like isoform X2 [Hyposmocoma kahamanoa]